MSLEVLAEVTRGKGLGIQSAGIWEGSRERKLVHIWMVEMRDSAEKQMY